MIHIPERTITIPDHWLLSYEELCEYDKLTVEILSILFKPNFEKGAAALIDAWHLKRPAGMEGYELSNLRRQLKKINWTSARSRVRRNRLYQSRYNVMHEIVKYIMDYTEPGDARWLK